MTKEIYTYVLECSDGSFYTGYTTDLAKRIKVHNSGRGAKYTKARRPVILKYYEVAESKSIAMKKEAAIKKLSRVQKELYINENMLYYKLEFIKNINNENAKDKK